MAITSGAENHRDHTSKEYLNSVQPPSSQPNYNATLYYEAFFHIYPHLDAAEYRNKLIGSIVKYSDLPIDGHMPYKASEQPRPNRPWLRPSAHARQGHGIFDINEGHQCIFFTR